MIIDILKKEIEEKLPHWLSPVARFSGHEEIMQRHRDKWLAEQRKLLDAGPPDEPRDPQGRWTAGGGGDDRTLGPHQHYVPPPRDPSQEPWEKSAQEIALANWQRTAERGDYSHALMRGAERALMRFPADSPLRSGMESAVARIRANATSGEAVAPTPRQRPDPTNPLAGVSRGELERRFSDPATSLAEQRTLLRQMTINQSWADTQPSFAPPPMQRILSQFWSNQPRRAISGQTIDERIRDWRYSYAISNLPAVRSSLTTWLSGARRNETNPDGPVTAEFDALTHLPSYPEQFYGHGSLRAATTAGIIRAVVEQGAGPSGSGDIRAPRPGTEEARSAAEEWGRVPSSEPVPLTEKEQQIREGFRKADISIRGSGPLAEKRLLDEYEERVGNVEPAEFKKQFVGGSDVSMHIIPETNSWEITGKLLHQGRVIGTYTREIDWSKMRAHSSYFKIYDKKDEGLGHGKAMLKGNIETYKKLGLVGVDVDANIDVGGYAWARYGYEPTRGSWMRLRDSIQEKIITEVPNSDPLKSKLLDITKSDNPKSLWAIADSKYGKKFLLGKNWIGHLEFNDKEQMDRFDAYVSQPPRRQH